jgi:hypothetical protein
MPIAIVSGALANKPGNGGEAWTRLSWALGLRRLGFDVHLIEEIAAADCIDESGRPAAFEHSANRAFFEATVRDFDLGESATLLCDGGRETVGRSLAELEEIAAEAEVLFDISGHLRALGVLAGPRSRVYVDLDPGFTQAWHADDSVGFRLGRHDHYVTVGLNVGRNGCPIPDCGLDWIPTLPPVLLGEWPVGQPPEPGPGVRFTTVASWRNGYGAPRIGGRETTLKHHQFRRFLELPARRPEARFELALGIEDGDRRDLEALAENGWAVVAPSRVARSPASFLEYIAGSSGEFSVAQGVYAETHSGWFSDRTAAYLASGRPALVQDTGIGGRLPIGEGLLTFASIDEAVAGARRIAADPVGHGEAARELAIEHLDSDRVLGALLERLGIGG